MAPKASELPSKIAELPTKFGELPPKTDELPPKTDELRMKTGDLPSKTGELRRKTDELPTKAAELATKTSELPAKTGELATKTSEFPAKTGELPPKTDELRMKTGELPTKSAELTPKTSELPSKTAELPPTTPENSTVEVPSGLASNSELISDKIQPAAESATVAKRPLVVMLPWLLAQPRNLLKYTPFYTDRGFDVLLVKVEPWQLLVPVRGVQLVAAELLEYLLSNAAYSPLIVHGFSVGGYIWGECCVKAVDSGERYASVMRRFVGQVWDSAADIHEIPVGVSSTLFPNSPRLRQALHNYITYHMSTFHDVSTRHYQRAGVEFRVNQIKAPALFFVSKNDQISSEKRVLRLRESWAEQGIKTYYKCWDVSPHAMHYWQHPQEYAAELNCFLNSLGLAKMAARIGGPTIAPQSNT